MADLADSGLLEFLCRAPDESDRDAALRAATRTCLSVPGARRSWARIRAAMAEAASGDSGGSAAPYALEIPVHVGGDVCGTLGMETQDPIDAPARHTATQVAEVLATLEARLCLADGPSRHTLVGCSPAIREVEAKARRYAGLDEPVLILGETGVGKELIARSIHCLSPRGDEPLYSVNCAAVPEELMVSELFGHRRGAFTGAIRRQRGRLEIADGATLFLDEVGDMGPRLQAALLRVIEYGEIQQLGDEGETRQTNVRIIAATNKDLAAEVEAGRFRSDLYYRLSALNVRVPPLRERAVDIPVLARFFLGQLEREWGYPLTLARRAMEKLAAYRFPGNVRELKNIVLRAAAVCRDGHLDDVELASSRIATRGARRRSTPRLQGRAGSANGNGHGDIRLRFSASGRKGDDGAAAGAWSHSGSGVDSDDPSPGAADGDLSLQAAMAGHLERVLAMADGNVSQAARILDIPRTTLQSKLARYGVRG